MGNWHISIEGCGSHHNGLETDAEQIASLQSPELIDGARRDEPATAGDDVFGVGGGGGFADAEFG